MKSKHRWLLLFALAGLTILALSGCGGEPAPTAESLPPSTETHTPAPSATNTPTATATHTPTPSATPEPVALPILGCAEGQVANGYFICDQVILIGYQDDISNAQDVLGLEEIGERLDLSFVETVSQTSEQAQVPPAVEEGDQSTIEAQGMRFPFHTQGPRTPEEIANNPLALGLFQFERTQWNILELLAAVNELSGNLYADPNYLVGHLANSPCSNPTDVKNRQFAVEGSQFAVEGSPNGGKGVPALAQDFWGQWAFRMAGVKPPQDRANGLTGEGVGVVVFDTSPYVETEFIGTADPPFTLNIMPVSSSVSIPLGSSSISPGVFVEDHGLFVAGLIHGVAPDSEIFLYPVLDSKGCGDLNTLVRAIFQSIVDRQGPLEPYESLVYNFSLGVQKPRTLPEDPWLLRSDGLTEEIESILRNFQEIEGSIESLSTAVFVADLQGVHIVAAAGNDSVSGILRLPPELPAAYSFVTGVESVNMGQELSCFSNSGDLAAPGGDALVDGNSCKPMANTCTMSGNAEERSCPWGLISLSTLPPTGYAYWEGTSFAAPLVSGLSAIILGDQQLSKEDLRTEILANFTLPPGSPAGKPIIFIPEN